MKKKFHLISIVVCITILSSLTGCQESSFTVENTEKQISANSEIACTMENEYPQQQISEKDISYLQEYMNYFPETALGVCYLGYREKGNTMPLADWIRASAPQLVEKMPFILEIAAYKERVLGDGYGDLFCFVPKDDNTTLGVNHVTWQSNGAGVWPVADEVLYRNEYAEPVLVFSNYEEFWDETNVMVNAYAGDGSNVQWCPYRNLDNNGSIDVPFVYLEDKYAGVYLANLIFDFTSFGTDIELDDPAEWDMWDYTKKLDPYDFLDDGWSPVYDTSLMNTNWQCGDLWYISFGQGNCDPEYAGCLEIYQRIETGQEYELMYSGVWRMEDNYLYIETISTQNKDTFNWKFLMLVSPSGEEMDIFREKNALIKPPFFDKDKDYMNLTYFYE